MPEKQVDEDDQYDDKYKIELLYRNLEYISGAFFSGEQIFPLWEAIYALIVGQLFVAFFTGKDEYRGSIAVAGMIFSFIWLLVVNISFPYSRDRTEKFGELEKILETEYNKIGLKLPGNSNFKFYRLRLSKQKKRSPLKKSILSTWSWRRWTPAFILALWIYLIWRWPTIIIK